ncbi:MAG: hypothetical protein JSU66_14505 [Deltaproteobacteria bacterium]|nr:MAG: hypothetical protein JSU66_14505 [Deltaproteobacteria bacterium]
MAGIPRAWLALVTLLCIAAPARAAEWFPLRPGVRWSYDVRGEASRTFAGLTQSERLQGTREMQVRGASPHFPDRPYEVLEAHRVHVESDMGARHTKSEMHSAYLKPAASGLLLYGEEIANPLQGGARKLVRHAKPIQLLPAEPKRGQRWNVGTTELDGLRLDLAGEVVGIQDAQTPAGTYRGCLKVQIHGTFSGQFSLDGLHARVTDGRYRATEWYAPGVGLVLVEEQKELRLALPAGQTVSASEHVWRTLRETNVAPAAPASPDTNR